MRFFTDLVGFVVGDAVSFTLVLKRWSLPASEHANEMDSNDSKRDDEFSNLSQTRMNDQQPAMPRVMSLLAVATAYTVLVRSIARQISNGVSK